MSNSQFQQELNALISEVAILKTKISDDEQKATIISVVQKAREDLKTALEKQELRDSNALAELKCA